VVALQFHELTVAAVVDETAEARSFVLSVPSALRDGFAYRAGQFLTVEVPWQDFAIRRCYSLSSAPEVDEAPRITVKRLRGGRMSNWLLDTVSAGRTLRVSPPEGRFVLDAQAGSRPLTLLGGGSGITPLLSLMKSALARGERTVRLIYANRERTAVIFADELAALARAHPGRVRIEHHLDAESGFLTVDALRRLLAGGEDGDHYVCGPTPLMDLIGEALEAAGVRGERRHFERFVSGVDPDRRAVITRARHAPVPAGFTIRLRGETQTVAYEAGLTLLAAAHRGGIKAPSSCEDGYCGSCKARLVRGQVSMRSPKALGPGEAEAGQILLCQAVPSSREALEVDCDALAPVRRPQPLAPRVLAALFVIVVLALFVLSRSQP
jgi:3-ketosteroid 9alpha-monooxygenase subunit B